MLAIDLSVVAGGRCLHDSLERSAIAAVGQRVERRARRVGVLQHRAARVGDRAACAATRASTPTHVGRGALAVEQRGGDVLVALRRQQQRQRDRAVEQVDAERLAGRLGIAVAVEQVVGELERDAELLAEALERLDARPVEAAEQAAERAGGARTAGRS